MGLSSNSNRSRYAGSLANASLRQRYEEQISAPDLLSLRDELSLVGARLSQLLDQLDGKGIDFVELAEIQQNILMYAMLKDYDGVVRTSRDMGVLIQKGIKEALVWKEAYQVIEQRRKLVDTEMKTLTGIGAMLSAEQFMILLGKLVAAVNLHVEQNQMAVIYGEFEKILELVPASGGGHGRGFTGVESTIG